MSHLVIVFIVFVIICSNAKNALNIFYRIYIFLLYFLCFSVDASSVRPGFYCMFGLMLNLIYLMYVSATWQCVLEEGHETNPQSSGPAETSTRPSTGDEHQFPFSHVTGVSLRITETR